MKTKKEVFLCPHCNVVEMEFVERIQSDKYFRMRRFKCPVCDHQEMYVMRGPDDLKQAGKKLEKLQREKVIRKSLKYLEE